VSRHYTRSARISALAQHKLQEQRRQIKPPALFPVRQNRAKHAPGTGASKKVLLIGSLVVRVTRREHHALDAQIHHFIEEGAYRFRIRAVEQSRIGGNAESALERFFDGL